MKIIVCKGCGVEIEQQKFRTHARLCQAYKDWKQSLIDKLTYDFLYHEYVEEEKSAGQIAEELGFSKNREVREKLKEYGIKERTLKESRKAKGYIKLCQKTSLERYGAPYHTMKESSIREKIDNAVRLKYGVDNVFQLEEVKEKIRAKKHFKKNTKKLKRVRGRSMQAEAFFTDLANRTKLDAMYKPHSKEFYIRKNKTVVYRYDFTVLSLKKIIEFNGSYWHANPKRYSHDFMVSKLTAQEIWDRDEDKQKLAKQQGFEVLVVWDDMSYEDMMQQCISFLLC